MDFIIFDLEFNQGFDFKKTGKPVNNIKCPFEIIEIGAVKLNENLETIDTFHFLVKPEIYKRLHPFVKDITKISMKDLKESLPFDEVYKKFLDFIDSNNDVFCVWGTVDLKELYRNAMYHKLHKKLLPKKYVDVQSVAARFLNNPNGSSIGLRNAVELLGIPLDAQFHNALHDSLYTAEVFKKLHTHCIKPQIYDFSTLSAPRRRTGQVPKMKLDKRNLFLQFEKMFNRNLTVEEKEMIKLAYKMGQTNQFMIETKNKQA
ncbi:MAG: exonuclease domain-containing protein [Epulopiscium sp.]|nr:exonuclease domain-containing protein [Candidatus Epulonipiscium sp.]